jgi:hypothetical protein
LIASFAVMTYSIAILLQLIVFLRKIVQLLLRLPFLSIPLSPFPSSLIEMHLKLISNSYLKASILTLLSFKLPKFQNKGITKVEIGAKVTNN